MHGPALKSQASGSAEYESHGKNAVAARKTTYVEPTQRTGDLSAIRWATRAAKDTTTSPQPAGLSIAPYTVVQEASAPHHTFRTAQSLPDLPYFGVVGRIATGDPIDLYRLTLNVGAGRLDFSLVSTQGDQPAPIQIQIFDGSGQTLGVWSSGAGGGGPLQSELSSLPPGTTLYFGITPGGSGPGAGPSQAIDYQLWIDRQSPVDHSTSDLTTVSNSAFGALVLVGGPALATFAGLGAAAPTGDTQATPVPLPNQQVGVAVTFGSVGTRSARPSAGLLSEGDPTPPEARDFSAAVNKDWDEPSRIGALPREANEVEPTALSRRENEPDALVVIDGPGGFPLLGAVAIGHRRRIPAADVSDFTTPRAIADLDPGLAAGFEAGIFIASADLPASVPGDTEQNQTLYARDRAEFPASVFSGLGLATVFTLNAVLSQPIAGFDYLTSLLDSNGRADSDWNHRRRMRAKTQ
jgi:hypothetical protein